MRSIIPPSLLLLTVAPHARALEETFRLAEYQRRNYTWPLKRYVPDTPGWKSLMDRRFEQVRGKGA